MILCKDASLLIGECYNAFGGLQTELDEIKLVFPLNSFHLALILKKKGFVIISQCKICLLLHLYVNNLLSFYKQLFLHILK